MFVLVKVESDAYEASKDRLFRVISEVWFTEGWVAGDLGSDLSRSGDSLHRLLPPPRAESRTAGHGEIKEVAVEEIALLIPPFVLRKAAGAVAREATKPTKCRIHLFAHTPILLLHAAGHAGHLLGHWTRTAGVCAEQRRFP